MIVKVCGISDIGKRRNLNEDSFGIRGFENDFPKGICVLADGMGGHNAGEVASSMAVDGVIGKSEVAADEMNTDNVADCLMNAIGYANESVYEMSLKNSEHAGMGTTLVVAYVMEDSIVIANIGDSRAYVVNNDEICRITVDHSVVEELVQRGSISREDARMHPDKNIITRALGTEPKVEADYYSYTVSAGDTIMLCSDGLTEMVREERIKEIICQNDDVNVAAKCLIDEANQNGGVDNVTVVALKFVEEECDKNDIDR